MELRNKFSVFVICLTIGLCGLGIFLSGTLNEKRSETQIEVSNTTETTTSSTNTTTTTKTTKKVVKTTKKKKKKKTFTKMNVKATRQQMIDYAYKRVIETWGEGHWNSFYQLVSHESGWNANNVNKKSGACGLFQFVPCSKGGRAYRTDYKVQIEKGILYIAYKYKTPNDAWKHWQKYHTY